jgi:hypothetical protein
MTWLLDDRRFSLRALPAHRGFVLSVVATLLAAADWLPENSLVDPDWLEFLLSLALGGTAVVMSLGDRLSPQEFAAWRNRA